MENSSAKKKQYAQYKHGKLHRRFGANDVVESLTTNGSWSKIPNPFLLERDPDKYSIYPNAKQI
ncbi:hypothetical protein C5167_007458 [Papaver somniferum]|nr:hypothetical protein C5167_007458 [Papaver somniferum]